MRTYKLLIVDDEYYIRQKLKKIIPWQENHLELAGEAANGLEAMALLTPFIDIIILDIKMPRMDGLETARQIHKDYPWIKIILLSGFSDFSYAQSAIKYGVSDYLLKPVDPQDLEAALEDCIKKIDGQEQEKHQMQDYHSQQKHLLYQTVLSGKASLWDLYEKYPQLKSYSQSFFLGVFFEDESGQLYKNLLEFLDNCQIIYEPNKESEFSYLIHVFCPNESGKVELKNQLQRFMTPSPIFMFFVIGSTFSLKEVWKPYYKNVLQQLYQRYFYDQSTVVDSPALSHQPLSQGEIASVRPQITYLINSKDSAGFIQYVEQLFTMIRKSQNIDFLNLVLNEIFLTYHLQSSEPVTSGEMMSSGFTFLLEEEHCLDNIKSSVISSGLNRMEQQVKLPSDIAISKKVVTYIQNHYAEIDLTVARLADLFQLNISYLGSLFKKVNGISILQYITTVRINAAKVLLSSHQYKISEIAQMVGYADIFYFSKRFKQITGLSPKEYAQIS